MSLCQKRPFVAMLSCFRASRSVSLSVDSVPNAPCKYMSTAKCKQVQVKKGRGREGGGGGGGGGGAGGKSQRKAKKVVIKILVPQQ